jgi:hypothetical protein
MSSEYTLLCVFGVTFTTLCVDVLTSHLCYLVFILIDWAIKLTFVSEESFMLRHIATRSIIIIEFQYNEPMFRALICAMYIITGKTDLESPELCKHQRCLTSM